MTDADHDPHRTDETNAASNTSTSTARGLLAGNFARAGLGILLIAIGALAITRLDKSIETVLVAASPQWLTDLTTLF